MFYEKKKKSKIHWTCFDDEVIFLFRQVGVQKSQTPNDPTPTVRRKIKSTGKLLCYLTV